MPWWMRHRYRGNKAWVRVDDAGRPVLDERGLAQLRYKPDDERTYTVRPGELSELEEAEPRVPDPEGDPPPNAPEAASGSEAPIQIYTDGASSGNPGPAGAGVVLLWRGHRRELRRHLGRASNNVAELSAVLEGLRAVTRPALPVRLHTDSEYVIGVLERGHRVRANRDLVAEIRREMERFGDLRLVKVPAHAGVPENERADRLARAAIAEQPE